MFSDAGASIMKINRNDKNDFFKSVAFLCFLSLSDSVLVQIIFIQWIASSVHFLSFSMKKKDRKK